MQNTPFKHTISAQHGQTLTDATIEHSPPSQTTSSTRVSDQEQFIRAIVTGVLEVLFGLRSADQLARWVNDNTYRRLVDRSARARRSVLTGRTLHRTPFSVGSIRVTDLTPGHIESSVLVQFPTRTRAVAVHLVELHTGRLRVENIFLL